MNKFSSIKKLFYIFFIAFLLTCIITFYYNLSVKDRFFKQIKISSNHLNESVLISYLKSKIGIDPIENIHFNFSEKVNQAVYFTKNPCTEITEINDIIPIVVTSSKKEIKIEIVSDDQNKINNCTDFIVELLEKENLRIKEFYKSLSKISGVPKFDKNMIVDVDNYIIDVDNYIDAINNYEKKFTDKTSLSKEDFVKLLPGIINILPFNSDSNLDLKLLNERNNFLRNYSKLLDEIIFLEITAEQTNVMKRVNIYFIFISILFLSNLLIIIIIKASNNKNKMLKIIDKILS